MHSSLSLAPAPKSPRKTGQQNNDWRIVRGYETRVRDTLPGATNLRPHRQSAHPRLTRAARAASNFRLTVRSSYYCVLKFVTEQILYVCVDRADLIVLFPLKQITLHRQTHFLTMNQAKIELTLSWFRSEKH